MRNQQNRKIIKESTKITTSNHLYDHIYELYQEIQQLQAENERLKEALQEIATNKFCSYAENEQTPYGFGVTDGHRYCQAIAQQALEKK